ncbi:MAG: glyoxalase-like domain protein [Geitlerinemataceae cyanobacterium]
MFVRLLAALPLFDTLFSTQGIMVMLLAAYGVAMWAFLTSAPKVYTVMVSDLEIARQFYEGELELPPAEVPLHYYYNYEQSLGTASFDPIYLSGNVATPPPAEQPEGLWYQLRRNVQLHIIGGASLGKKQRQRHVSFDRDCLENLLLQIQARGTRYKIRGEKPLNFLVKDIRDRVIEMTEASR